MNTPVVTELGISPLVAGAVMVVIVTVFIAVIVIAGFRRVPVGRALLVEGGRNPRVSFSNRFVMPFFRKAHLLELTRVMILVDLTGRHAARSRDGVAYEVSACAYVRLGHTEEQILNAATVVGVDGLQDPVAVSRLLKPTLINAIKSGLEDFNINEMVGGYRSPRRAVLAALAAVATDGGPRATSPLAGFIVEDVTLGNVVALELSSDDVTDTNEVLAYQPEAGEVIVVDHEESAEAPAASMPLRDEDIPDQLFELLKHTLPSIPVTPPAGASVDLDKIAFDNESASAASTSVV